MKKDKFPKQPNRQQVYSIYKDLEIPINDATDFYVSDIFKYLPHEITYEGLRGDLSVTPYDIAYWSIDGIWKHQLVYCAPINDGEDVYDAFIKMGKFLKENNLM
jgi:hypothetical protein